MGKRGTQSCQDRRLWYVLRASGMAYRFWTECGHWNCEPCRGRRLLGIVEKLAERAPEKVGVGTVADRRIDTAARKLIRARHFGYLAMSLRDGGAFIVCEQPVAGRKWALEPRATVDVIAEIYPAWPYAQPVRTDFVGAWRDERQPRAESEPPLIRVPAASEKSLRRKLQRVDVDVDADWIPEAAEVAERMAVEFSNDTHWYVRDADGHYARKELLE